MKFYSSKFYCTKQLELVSKYKWNPILSFHLSFKFVDLPIICSYGNSIL